jgi:CRISPR-associated endonuclease/helicase Cas3
VWAHSSNAAGVRHSLTDHLYGTAELAREFASAFGAGDAGHFLGLAHDAGKASCTWQEGLARAEKTGGRVGVDHKALGVYLAGRRGLGPAQYALHGHHGGLTSRDYIGRKMREERAGGGEPRRAEAEAALRHLVPGLFDAAPVPLPDEFEEPSAREFLVRFLFSCLVDADALDTGAHRGGLPRPQLPPTAGFEQLVARFEVRRAELLGGRGRSPADRWRGEVYESCVAAAGRPGGLFRLAAPTGAGKTLAAAAFALRHAAVHRKARVVVAVPFITITEQNAAVYRRLLDPGDPCKPPVVLEHHSHVDFDTGSAGDRWRRLAAENWDAPFVVTTTVQLFESLFGRMPSRMRKVHRLANAVIVLDEVQALPHSLLVPLADALRLLAGRFGATVVLSSATQPELWSLGPLREVPAHDIINDPVPLFGALQHTRFEWWLQPRPTLEQVARRAAGETGSALVVVNTVKDARTVFATLRVSAGSDTAVRHLSAAMCPAHRQLVLDEVLERLAAGLPVLLVSTQLVEAGVDVDFPVVYRAVAPADSLWQAAGRANREGHLGRGGGRVVVFYPADGGMPGPYRTQVGTALAHFGPGKADPDDLAVLRRYYQDLYRSVGVETLTGRGAAIQRHRQVMDFLAVADGPEAEAGGGRRDRSLAFRMIDDDTVPVVVAYGDAGQRQLVAEATGQLRHAEPVDRRWLRVLQPYTVQVRKVTANRPEVAAMLRPVAGDLSEWAGGYDDAGLALEPSGEEYIA